MLKHLITTCMIALPLTANSALFDRGNGLIYDEDLDITWLQDANYAMTSGYDADGKMNWSEANTWVASLDINGFTEWRLPNTNPIDGTTDDDINGSFIGTEDRGENVSAPGTLYEGSTASEMAYLFFNTLGNLGFCDSTTATVDICNDPAQPGYGLSNTGPFNNFQSLQYWSVTELALDTNDAWYFDFGNGIQDFGNKDFNFYTWAVHNGDIGAVPIPSAVWLFGSGLIGLVGVARRKANA